MYIQLDSQVLYYKKTGKGRPLLMLHGNGETHEIFDALSDELTNSFTMYLPDSRGHGLSSPSEEYHYADMAVDMANLIRAIDIGRCDILGFSDGGIVAMLLAMDHPELVRRMILCGVNLSPAGLTLGARHQIKKMYRRTKDPIVGMMLNEPNIDPKELSGIEAPTLVCAGEKDMVRLAETKTIVQGIPGAKMLVLEGEDHGSYVIDSTRLAPSIRKFLG